jgi:hypothetical protein
MAAPFPDDSVWTSLDDFRFFGVFPVAFRNIGSGLRGCKGNDAPAAHPRVDTLEEGVLEFGLALNRQFFGGFLRLQAVGP